MIVFYSVFLNLLCVFIYFVCLFFHFCRDCRVVRDPQTLKSKGYGFVSFVKKSVSVPFLSFVFFFFFFFIALSLLSFMCVFCVLCWKRTLLSQMEDILFYITASSLGARHLGTWDIDIAPFDVCLGVCARLRTSPYQSYYCR